MSIVETIVIGGAILLSLLFNYYQIRARRKEMQSYMDSLLILVLQTSSLKDIIDVLMAKDHFISSACLKELQRRGIAHDNIVKMITQAKMIARAHGDGKKSM